MKLTFFKHTKTDFSIVTINRLSKFISYMRNQNKAPIDRCHPLEI